VLYRIYSNVVSDRADVDYFFKNLSELKPKKAGTGQEVKGKRRKPAPACDA